MKRWLYRLRYKLCRKLLPEHLAVYMYEGAEYVPLYDEDTHQTWGYARVENHRVVSHCVMRESGR